MMRVIGIDPGLSGACAVLTDGDLTDLWDMPVIAGHVDAWLLADRFRALQPTIVAVEFVRSRPGMSAPSVFKFGEGYGMLLGVIAALRLPYREVTPKEWTHFHRVGSDKEQHIRRAKELFPESTLSFQKSKDGRADAALIAAWADRQGAQPELTQATPLDDVATGGLL